MSKIVMFPHVGSGNHGCEAIVRSTLKLLKDKECILFSDHPEEDIKYMSDVNLVVLKGTSEVQRFSVQHINALLKKYFCKDSMAFDKSTFSPVLKKCKKNEIMLSIGGDLYCYETPEYIYRVNDYVREQGCKTVLWGCSVEPSYIDSVMKEDLKKYDLICARESITFETLKKINPNTIFTVDPAFTLPQKEVELPAKSYIGINISPLVVKREEIQGITLENYRGLIQFILDTTTDSVALIPHVVWKTNDDRTILKQLKEFFKENDRVVMVEDHNCIEQKYIIAHCRFFIGARTHATIAAYSSCVPTLVVGYSVKAKGIAKDLFGRYEDYVVPVQVLRNKDDLIKAYRWLYDHEDEIRDHLKKIMPEYQQRAYSAVEAIKKLEQRN